MIIRSIFLPYAENNHLSNSLAYISDCLSNINIIDLTPRPTGEREVIL